MPKGEKWSVQPKDEDDDLDMIRDGDGRLVAIVGLPEEASIITAAPQMLEALKAALSALNTRRTPNAKRKVAAAIAAAEGGEG